MAGKEKYVVSGAIIKCSTGSKSTVLRVTSQKKETIKGKRVATIMDHIPGANIFPVPGAFGICKVLTAAAAGVSVPCECATASPWILPYASETVGNFMPLLEGSKLICPIGGVIKINNVKQRLMDNSPAKPRCFVCGKDFHGLDYKKEGTNERGNITGNLIAAFKKKGVKMTKKTHVFYRGNVLASIVAQAKKTAKEMATTNGTPTQWISVINANKDLFLKVPDPVEGHHLITCEAVSEQIWYGLFVQYGYDINCAQNGVLLPGDILVACHFKVPLHMGGHGSTFTDFKELGVRKSYVQAVKALIKDIKKSYQNQKECKKITDEDVRKFHRKMMNRSEMISKKVKKIEWKITADGHDYDDGGIGCYNMCRTLSSKKAEMEADLETQQAKGESVETFGEIISQVALNNNRGCTKRNHKDQGCYTRPYNWYGECRYNELSDEDLGIK